MTWPGIYLGTVVHTADPTGNGRIRLQVPQVSGLAVTGWAPPATSGGTAAPSPGQLVWVMYQGGDASYPVYIPPIEVPLATSSGSIYTGASIEQTAARISAATVGSGASESLQLLLAGPVASGATDSVTLQLNSQANDGSSLANLIVQDVGSGTMLLSLDVTKAQISTYLIKVGQTWQTPTGLGSGWALGPHSGTVQPLQYCIDAMDTLTLVGAVNTTTTSPASVIFNLPSAYRPKKTQRSGAVSNSAGTPTIEYVEVNSNGNVSVSAVPTSGNADVYFQIGVPMGNKN